MPPRCAGRPGGLERLASGCAPRRRAGWAAWGLGLLLAPAPAQAAAPELLGAGPRNAALAQASTAAAEPAEAALVAPTEAAHDGAAGMLAYGRGWARLRLRGEAVDLPDVRGLTFGLQRGARIAGGPAVGVALGGYVPDQGLTRVIFRPAHEPVFVRQEAAASKAVFDLVAAVGGRVKLALGASIAAATEGRGVDVTLAQDARGVHADGSVDLSVAYRLAPIVGLSASLSEATSLALRLRGARSFGAALDATTTVTIRDNPLSGSTLVRLRGDAAYDPLLIDLGVAHRFALGGGWRGLVVHALRYERWSVAPSPVADATLDLRLILRPFERTETFAPPSLADTIAPRFGFEASSPGRLLSLRAGYALVPTPLRQARGYLTPINPTYHEVSLGAGLSLSRWLRRGLPVSLDAAASAQIVPEEAHHKSDLTLPWASYTVGGSALAVSVGASVAVE